MDVSALESPEKAEAAGGGKQGQESQHWMSGHLRTRCVNRLAQEEAFTAGKLKKANLFYFPHKQMESAHTGTYCTTQESRWGVLDS